MLKDLAEEVSEVEEDPDELELLEEHQAELTEQCLDVQGHLYILGKIL